MCVYVGESIAHYGFPAGHPFGQNRMAAFWDEMVRRGLDAQVCMCDPISAPRSVIERFHTPAYVDYVQRRESGGGYLDSGDTPVYPGLYEAAACVVGTSVDAVRRIMAGDCRRAFVPIAGLHHARRDGAAGFCVFNDCGVVIETLRSEHGIRRIAYVDIDAHHGDGVFYAFEDDPLLFFADMHEDGRYLYPGTGAASEQGIGEAAGTKLNLPMPPGADDAVFLEKWGEVERFIDQAQPEFILLQCGADSLRGDPIAHLAYSARAHAHAASRLARLADRHSGGRMLGFGGGGYDLENLAVAWTAVVAALAQA